MKIPKDLQKKYKKKPKEKRKDRILNSYIQAFKNSFLELMMKFDDRRKLEYINETNDVSAETGNNPRFAIKWNEKKIKISIFRDEIEKICGIIKSIRGDIDFIELHKQIANHEYGHILSAKTTYDLYPDEARDYDLFELTQEQLLPMHHSPLEEKMMQVSIERLVGTFWEFLGNYTVREKIDPNTPSDSLKSKESNAINIIREIESKGSFTLQTVHSSPNVMNKGFDRFFTIHRISDEFYIFKEWEQFCSLFKGKSVEASLKLMKFINELFENTIKINSNINAMKEDIIELAKYLDRLNFKNITQNNVLSNSDKAVLKEFIQYLKDKQRMD